MRLRLEKILYIYLKAYFALLYNFQQTFGEMFKYYYRLMEICDEWNALFNQLLLKQL